MTNRMRGRPRSAPGLAELERLLRKHKGNVAAIARACGLSRETIHRALRREGLDPAAYRLVTVRMTRAGRDALVAAGGTP